MRRVAAEHPVTFIAFDLLELDGRDLLSTELRIRKKTLRETIVDSPHILFAEHVERDGISLFEVARESGIEGHRRKARRFALPARDPQRRTG